MSDGDLFSKLSRYESRLFRELERTLSLWRKAQAERLHVPSGCTCLPDRAAGM